MDSSLRIIVTGLIAQHPLLGGVAWDYLQYPLGLARLGHDVYYFEDSGEWPYNLDGGPSGSDWVAHDCNKNVNYLQTLMSRFGLENKWAYRFPTKAQWYGLSDRKRTQILESADLLINVSGSLEDPELYRQVGTLIYIDSDPVFTQIKLAKGNDEFCKRVNAHDAFFTFGECLPQGLPALDYNWRATRQPIVLSEWDSCRPQRDVFTTVMSWTSYQPLDYAGNKYGQKDIEFKRFLNLPAMVGPAVMEVALGKLLHTAWQTDDEDFSRTMVDFRLSNPKRTVHDFLIHVGWNVVDAMETCRNIDRYREYIQSSKAEWSVAKNGYVLGQPGWFSCRSACYLAAGKPVIAQDTGFAEVLPTGEGILKFRTPEEAVAAIQEIDINYSKHAAAARAIADEYFDADKVLSRMIEETLRSDANL
jgi:hypothetical protein